jgi:O-antigen/teichoic acid export membrane protein
MSNSAVAKIFGSPAGRRLISGSARGAIGKLAAVAAAFLLQIIVSREYGATGTGYFFLTVSTVTVFAVLGRLGIDMAVVRFFAPPAAEGNILQIRYLYGRLLAILTVSSTALALLLLALSGPLATGVFEMPALADYIGIMWAGVVPLAIIVFHARLFQAVKSPGLAVFSEAGLQNSLLVAALLLPLVAGQVQWLWTYCAAIAAAILVSLFVYGLRGPANGKRESSLREVLGSAWTLFPAVIVSRIVLPWASVIMLGIWGSAEEVGIFSAATRIAMLVSFAIIPVNSIAMPEFAAMFKAGRHDEIKKLARQASLLSLVIAAPVAAASFMAPDFVMSLFGAEFSEGGSALLLLVAGQLVNVVTGPASAILVVSGREPDQRTSAFVGAIVMLGTGVTLIPSFGMIGAATATAAAIAAMNVTAAIFVFMRFGIKTLPGLGN